MDTIQSNEVKNMMSQPPTFKIGGYDEILAYPSYYSKISGSSEECLLQSQIVSTEVMPMYIEKEVKSHKTLKDVFLEDHERDLKSCDCHDKAIVVLYHHDCKKTSEGLMGNILKNTFSIFQF